jgi:hypothetical protein
VSVAVTTPPRAPQTRARTLPGRLVAPVSIAAGAALLRLISGVGFVNYDTLYALAWGGQLSRGQTPAYGVAIAPTPHPLLELLGLALSPLSARAIVDVTIALGFLALAGCGWVLYRLGSAWWGRLVGAVAALAFLTRVPVLSYGVRAYVDVPYVLLVLAALLVEVRRPRAGAPVMALLALAGLLRPEAWAFSGLYWLYWLWRTGLIADRFLPRGLRGRGAPTPERRPTAGQALAVTALAASAPVLWIASDLAVTGHPFWSLTNTRHTATELGRVKGIANVPEYIPRRIGEVLQGAIIAGAALGGLLSLAWLPRRALPAAVAGVVAVLVFALFAAFGLPIDTRYAFLAAAILCIFCGVCVGGWLELAPAATTRRRWWLAAAAAVVVAIVATAPAQYRSAHHELSNLSRQARIEGDLLAFVPSGAINLRCGPVGVPNHAPIPLLALYLEASPARIVSAQVGQIERGVYVDPATHAVERDYVLDPRDPHVPVSVPAGFAPVARNASWVVYRRCA